MRLPGLTLVRPIAYAVPVLWIVAPAAFLTTGRLAEFSAMAAVAVVFGAALWVAARMLHHRDLLDGSGLQRRESVALAVIIPLAVLAAIGDAALTSTDSAVLGFGSTAVIHGVFGVGVCTGLLIAWLVRGRAASAAAERGHGGSDSPTTLG